MRSSANIVAVLCTHSGRQTVSVAVHTGTVTCPFNLTLPLISSFWYCHWPLWPLLIPPPRTLCCSRRLAGWLKNNLKISKLILRKFSGSDCRPKNSWLVKFQIPADLLSGGLCSLGAFETCIIPDINWSFHTFVEVVSPLVWNFFSSPITCHFYRPPLPRHFQESEVFCPFSSLSTHVLHHWEPVCHGNVDKLHFTAFSRRQFQLKRDLKWKSTF